MQSVKSTCPYCGVGCGVNVSGASSSKPLILGDKSHPANSGRLCSKGSALGETLAGAGEGSRLTYPMVDGERVDWEEATSAIAEKISASIEEHGQSSVAFYLSGQLLTEDYYVANKLMKGCIGTANVDTNSRLCMSSAVAAYKRAFGSDTVPCSYEDIDHAELIILIGSNAAWTHPVLYQRMVEAKQQNPNLKVVLIDPRKTASCELADLHLDIKPSSDGYLFQGLLRHLIETDSIDEAYIDQHTDGFESAKAAASHLDLVTVAAKTEVNQEQLQTFYKWFASTPKALSFYSQGINQSATGTDKCNAIINCHLATGKIGYAGAGPFSITGQPNAMGGREVGGLANLLAAHMDFNQEDCDRVQRFWKTPTIATEPGLKAVDLFNAVADGRIKVIWILATNPAVSLPNSNSVRDALAQCPTVIVSDVTQTDTTRFANILLPAQAWGEKEGTVTNSERCISRQRQFLRPTEYAKPDWWALAEVGKKMGFKQHFDFQNAHQIFIEHSKLSGFENNGTRAFDISGLSDIDQEAYDALAPIQWPVNRANPNGRKRMFEDAKFYTPNTLAKFVVGVAALAGCVKEGDGAGSFILNTGRLRDQWHTMTRTGNAPSLSGHDDIPFVQVSPVDAGALKLNDKQFVRLWNECGEFVASVALSSNVKSGQLFSAIHWNDQFATKAVVNALLNSEVDPISGQPELKASRVSMEPFECISWARVASEKSIVKGRFDVWVQTKTKRGYITLLGSNEPVNWRKWSETYLGSNADYLQFSDDVSGSHSLLAAGEKSIKLMVYAHTSVEQLPSFAWQSMAFDENNVQALAHLLRFEDGAQDQLVCSCFGISKKAISKTIIDGAKNLSDLGAALGCGSKCGSCKPELSMMLKIEQL